MASMTYYHSKMGKKIQRTNISASCIRKSKGIKRKESSLMEEIKFYYILGRKLTRKSKTGYSRLEKPEPIKLYFNQMRTGLITFFIMCISCP